MYSFTAKGNAHSSSSSRLALGLISWPFGARHPRMLSPPFCACPGHWWRHIACPHDHMMVYVTACPDVGLWYLCMHWCALCVCTVCMGVWLILWPLAHAVIAVTGILPVCLATCPCHTGHPGPPSEDDHDVYGVPKLAKCPASSSTYCTLNLSYTSTRRQLVRRRVEGGAIRAIGVPCTRVRAVV